jgi:hypothetical protein
LRRHGELEAISLDKLAGASIEDEMHAVLAELVPKLRDAGRAAAMLRDKQLDPLKLPSVVALTRATMFIPKGSLRDGAINDAVSAAKHADSWLLQIAAFALAAVTFLPSAGASLGVAAGIGAIGLAAHAAVEEWELYSTQRVLSNTHMDLARSLATEEPSLTGFAFSLAGLGLELAPLAGAFHPSAQAPQARCRGQ